MIRQVIQAKSGLITIDYDSSVYPPEYIDPENNRVYAHEVAEFISKYAKKYSSVIDVGTGTGIVAIILEKLRPDLLIEAVDNDDDALKIAQQNIINNESTVSLFNNDLVKGLGHFDVVFANLPRLIKGQSHTKGPVHASFVKGSDDMVLYRRLFKMADTDYLIVECTDKIFDIADQSGYNLVEQSGYVYCFKKVWYNKRISSDGY